MQHSTLKAVSSALLWRILRFPRLCSQPCRPPRKHKAGAESESWNTRAVWQEVTARRTQAQGLPHVRSLSAHGGQETPESQHGEMEPLPCPVLLQHGGESKEKGREPAHELDFALNTTTTSHGVCVQPL